MNQTPLAYRLRPKKIEDIIGQDHIIGKDKLLYRAIKADKLTSMILYGPPGCGKTTIANIIAETTFSNYLAINATTSNKAEMEKVVESAKEYKSYGKKTVLFIDEIHRFNKAQQDYLLPFVENGLIILIGATTENPYFEVNNALLSRSIIFQLNQINDNDIIKVIDKAITDKENGYGNENVIITNEAKNFISKIANGDIRRALNGLELAVLTTEKDDKNCIKITLEVAKECMQNNTMRFDKDGDEHYNVVSAFIKSMRGSDVNASIYYLARLIKSGEDIKFIARRIMICAAEDIGLADPNALVVATNASLAIERIGMPESRIILAEAVAYIANAPKSNKCYTAIDEALELVEKTGNLEIPKHLKDAHYKGASKLGNGIGYLYPHDYENNYVKQEYLPEKIKDTNFFK